MQFTCYMFLTIPIDYVLLKMSLEYVMCIPFNTIQRDSHLFNGIHQTQKP